jgi:regulatory protein
MAENLMFETALKKAMALCASREFCISDIRGKLDSWSVEEKDSARIISRLISEKFIDEERYCLAYVKDKFRYNRWGKIKIAAGLKLKKIPSATVSSALAIIDEDEYRKVLNELIAAHRKKTKSKNQYDLKGKLMRFGLSRGFESHLLYDLLNDSESI